MKDIYELFLIVSLLVGMCIVAVPLLFIVSTIFKMLIALFL